MKVHALVVMFAMNLVACGGGAAGDVPAGAAARLDPLTAAVSSAVEHHDRLAADRALAQLSSTIASLRANDELNAAAANRIEQAAAHVARELDAFLPTTSSTTTTTEPATTNDKRDRKKGDHGD